MFQMGIDGRASRHLSPDGRIALTGSSDNTARLWDVATGLSLGAPLRYQGFLQAAAFHPDG
jgi:WD40 repeat protein